MDRAWRPSHFNDYIIQNDIIIFPSSLSGSTYSSAERTEGDEEGARFAGETGLYDYREGSDFMLSVPVITIHFLYLGPILTLHSLLTLFAPIDCKDGFVENIIMKNCRFMLSLSHP